jgi:uncharacterized membrane protein
MAFCGKCGSAIADGVAFCPRCGAPVGPVMQAAPAGGVPAVPVASGMTENVAGFLCYILGWLTGIIFLLVDKRPFVRFHAAQSIVVFGGLTIIHFILAYGVLGWHTWDFWSLWNIISLLVNLVGVVLWILLMVTAYQGKTFEVPVVAGIAKSIAGNPTV